MTGRMLPETMLAVTAAGGPRAVEVPVPGRTDESEVLVRIERVGICGTDLALFDGYTPFQGIIGHEFAGVVVESDLYSWIRRRVTASINIPRDLKGAVDEAAAKHAPDRAALGIRDKDGVMAEYAVLPEGLLIQLPDEVSDEVGAFAEPLAAAMDAVEKLDEVKGEVLLIGDGRLAQLIGRVLQLRGIACDVLGRSATKLELLKATGVRRVMRAPFEAKTQYAHIIEASGSPGGLQSALALVRPTGRIVVKSTFPGAVEVDLASLVVDEVELVGSRCGDVHAAVDLLASGAIDLSGLLTAVYPLREAEEAFRRVKRKDSIKIQLSPHSR